MNYLSKPGVAIAFGAFFLCAETCLHADSVLQFPTRPLELPVYDWAAGGLLLTAGLLSRRDQAQRRRQLQAVAWAFMLSLLVGATFSLLEEWGTPPADSEWFSEGTFLAIVLTMTVVAVCALVATMRSSERR